MAQNIRAALTGLLVAGLAPVAFVSPALAQIAGEAADGIDYGSNTSPYANDGECDDPRFTGAGMASNTDWTHTAQDADDCRDAVANGARFWPSSSAFVLAQCDSVDFGDDTSQYAEDGECDDPRFYGPDVDAILLAEDLRSDFSDCMAACLEGTLFVRPMN